MYYFVSINGNDSLDGMSEEKAFRSLQKALNLLKDEDTLFITNGYYAPQDEGLDSFIIQGLKKIYIFGLGNNVVIGGRERGVSEGTPQQGLQLHNNQAFWVSIPGTKSYYKWTRKSLFNIDDCEDVYIGNITVRDSLGEALSVHGSKGRPFSKRHEMTSKNITIENCHFTYNRQRTNMIQKTTDITFKNCRFSFSSWALGGGSGGPQFQTVHNVKFQNCLFDHLCGETVVFSNAQRLSEGFPCSNVEISDCVEVNCEDGFYICATDGVTFIGNVCLSTPQEWNSPHAISSDGGGNVGAVIRAAEGDLGNDSIFNVLVVGNLFYNLHVGTRFKVDPIKDSTPGYIPGVMEHIYVTGNTFVDCGTNVLVNTRNTKDCVFANNLSVNGKPQNHVSVNSDAGDWITFNNAYVGPGDILANIKPTWRGANDLYLSNLTNLFVNPLKYESGKVYDLGRAGYMANLDIPVWDFTGYRPKENSSVVNAGKLVTPPTSWSVTSMGKYLNAYGDPSLMGNYIIPEDVRDIGAFPHGSILPDGLEVRGLLFIGEGECYKAVEVVGYQYNNHFELDLVS